MKHIYIQTLLFLTVLLVSECVNPPVTTKPKEKEHLNILICSDLSNRLTIHKKTESDVKLISKFLDLYPKEMYYSMGRKRGQNDIVKTLFLNDRNIKSCNINSEDLEIDLSSQNDAERIKFIKNIDTVKNYKIAKQNFKRELAKLYSCVKEKPQGADLYNFFNQKLDSIYIKKKGYRNILLLFTDGYIEYGSYQKKKNKSFYLSQSLIASFRKAYKKSEETNIKSFFNKNNYGIQPIENSVLQHLEVLALEFYDRSLSKGSNTSTDRPTDYEIIKLFWEDWMKKSNVKFFKSYKFGSVEDFEKRLVNFIEHPSNQISKIH